MIILDASVLIAHFSTKDVHHEEARSLLLTATPGTLVASDMTLAEVLAGPAKVGQLSQMEAALARLGIDNVPFPVDTPVKLAKLRARTSLKLPDCCVLLAAEEIDAEAVATFDDKLGITAEKLGFKRA